MYEYERCYYCNEKIYPTAYVVIISNNTCCKNKECIKKDNEFGKKKSKILKEFADEKEKVLRPLKEKLDTELFLNERDFMFRG